ncbi:unnamed protein product [Owenia fusiformis]|nr:unnamed protein product [Owenia fusiformis]
MEDSRVTQDHRESLARIRKHLGLEDVNKSFQGNTSHVVPNATRTFQKSKLGKLPKYEYRRSPTPPSQLPRIQTPPEHDQYYDKRALRGRKYDVVPPLYPTAYDHNRESDEDSWGEESSDEDTYHPWPSQNGLFQGYPPQNGALSMVPFGNPYAKNSGAPMMFPMPMMFIPPNFQHNKKPKKHKNAERRLQGGVSVRDAYGANDSFLVPRQKLLDALKYLSQNPMFARDFIDQFLLDFLDEEIPDLLIQVITGNVPEPGKPGIPQLLDRNSNFKLGAEQEIEQAEIISDITEELIAEEISQVGKETIQDLAGNVLERAQIYDVTMDMVLEILSENAIDIVEDAMHEVEGEEILNSFLEEELNELCQKTAVEVLTHYDSKIRRRELKQIMSDANEKVLDSLMLDHLLANVARQGQLWTEDDFAEKILDSEILDILLFQHFQIRDNAALTLNNRPLRKFHERVVTDVALDVLLGELGESLEEDLLDIDEYEVGLNDTNLILI